MRPYTLMMHVTEISEDVEALYRSQGPRLWSAVRAYTRDRDIADDAVSEAFAHLLRRGAAVRDSRAWVWTTAFRIASRELQQRSATVSDPPDTPYDPAMADQRVLSAIARLSERQRASVLLHYYADLPVKEIARSLGSTPAAVGVHLFRARKNLRALLGDDL